MTLEFNNDELMAVFGTMLNEDNNRARHEDMETDENFDSAFRKICDEVERRTLATIQDVISGKLGGLN